MASLLTSSSASLLALHSTEVADVARQFGDSATRLSVVRAAIAAVDSVGCGGEGKAVGVGCTINFRDYAVLTLLVQLDASATSSAAVLTPKTQAEGTALVDHIAAAHAGCTRAEVSTLLLDALVGIAVAES